MYRVRTVFTGVPGTPWYSNLFFDDQAPGGPAGAVTAVAAFWNTLASIITEDVSWTVEGAVPAISPGTGQIENVFVESDATGTGTATGEALPWATQGLVQMGTDAYMNGRRLRGRLFVPGLTEASSIDGTIAPGTRTGIRGAANTLMGSSNVGWVIYSRKNFIQSPVTAVEVAPYWAVLRSRRD